MSGRNSREILLSTLSKARRRLYLHALYHALCWWLLGVLPIAAVLVAVDQYWNAGRYGGIAAASLIGVTVVMALLLAARRLGTLLGAAIEVDERAGLRGRISSAWEFLHEKRLDDARLAQVRDAVDHATKIAIKPLFRGERVPHATLVPVLTVVLLLSFLVPTKDGRGPVEAAVNPVKERQLSELRQLQDELRRVDEREQFGDVLEKLKEIEQRFQDGAMKSRDVMIELARLDEHLTKRMAGMGVENLANEVTQLLPHLSASQASQPVAQAIKEEKLDQAAEEMNKLTLSVERDELTDEQKNELALNMGVAASKLGGKPKNSFSGDLAKASEALKSGDRQKFSEAGTSMGTKMRSVDQHKKMESMRKRISLYKAGLGRQDACSVCNGQGCQACKGGGLGQGKDSKEEGQGESGAKGGLKAGTQAAGDPLGDGTRLADSYRKLLKVTGTAGTGPVESEVEVTEGATSDRGVSAKEIYEEYAAVAEQAIEREEIPLSHRFHVKRYFQAIRPAE